MLNCYQQLFNELSRGPQLILGTLLDKKGSAPQIPGASAIFTREGLSYGTLGGGLLESRAEEFARKGIPSGTHLLHTVTYNAGIESREGAICGGSATFLLDFHPEQHYQVFRRMNQDLKARLSGFLITLIDTESNIDRHWMGCRQDIPEVLIPYRDIILEACQTNPVHTQQSGDKIVLIEYLSPPPQLLIVGAGHIGQALARQGSALGFEVTVADNRPGYATPQRVPAAHHLVVGELSPALQKINIGPDTFVVIVTQGHRSDYEALQAVIASGAAYIGMIGSQRKIKLIKEDLIQNGVAGPALLSRLHAPIGLPIGAQSVEEIAISIAAEIIQVKNQKPSGRDSSIAVLILAAGLSTRMQKPKMLLPFKGKSVIETVTLEALRSRANHTVVVTGCYGGPVTEQLQHLPVHILYNEHYENGMLSSVQCGLDKHKHGKAIIVLPGDQPLVKAHTINRLIESYRTTDKGLTVPVFNGKKGHPVLIDSKYFDEIMLLDPAVGLKQLFHRHADDTCLVHINSEEVILDIDWPEDYQYALKHNSRHS